MVTEYYGDVFIQDSGAPQKPRVVTLNTMVGLNTIVDLDFSDLTVKYSSEFENQCLWKPAQKPRVF